MPDTVIAAHRGLDDAAPENTLPAFRAALDEGLAIEFDVRVTADEEIVVIHDAAVDRTTDGTGPVSDMTLSEIHALDAGGWFADRFEGVSIPTFSETLDLVSERMRVSPSMALDISPSAGEYIHDIYHDLQSRELTEHVVVIGAVIRSPTLRREFAATTNGELHCCAVAESPGELPEAVEDRHSSWVYVRFVPTEAHVRQVRNAGKSMFVSGDEVSHNPTKAHEALRSSPEMLLTWETSALFELINSNG